MGVLKRDLVASLARRPEHVDEDKSSLSRRVYESSGVRSQRYARPAIRSGTKIVRDHNAREQQVHIMMLRIISAVASYRTTTRCVRVRRVQYNRVRRRGKRPLFFE